MSGTSFELVDLRSITREADRIRTKVVLLDRFSSERTPWLLFGSCQVRFFENKHSWWLSAYMTSGVTDFEHDSAYALRLPLIGMTFDGVEYGSTLLRAWVDPEGTDDFCVPTSSEYDPTKHPDATTCNYDRCAEDPHIIVPEGFYVPPFDRQLFERVRGRKVEIRIGPAREDV
jgi:hypothetical protein